MTPMKTRRGLVVIRRANPRHVGVVRRVNRRLDGSTRVQVKWENGWIEILNSTSCLPIMIRKTITRTASSGSQ